MPKEKENSLRTHLFIYNIIIMRIGNSSGAKVLSLCVCICIHRIMFAFLSILFFFFFFHNILGNSVRLKLYKMAFYRRIAVRIQKCKLNNNNKNVNLWKEIILF